MSLTSNHNYIFAHWILHDCACTRRENDSVSHCPDISVYEKSMCTKITSNYWSDNQLKMQPCFSIVSHGALSYFHDSLCLERIPEDLTLWWTWTDQQHLLPNLILLVFHKKTFCKYLDMLLLGNRKKNCLISTRSAIQIKFNIINRN